MLCGFFFFFPSPNLSRHRLDLCHTSTHGVALVRIYNAGLKCTVRGSLKYRTQTIAKNLPLHEHHCTTLSGCTFATKTSIDNRKKLVKQQYLLHLSSQYGIRGPLMAEIGLPVWVTQQISTGFAYWLRYSTATSLIGGQPNFARRLAVSWAGTLCAHFLGFLPRCRMQESINSSQLTLTLTLTLFLLLRRGAGVLHERGVSCSLCSRRGDCDALGVIRPHATQSLHHRRHGLHRLFVGRA